MKVLGEMSHLSLWEGLLVSAAVWGLWDLTQSAFEVMNGQMSREDKMPVAVVMEEPQRFDLKTLPGAYVCIKRMNYGEKLQVRGFNDKMTMKTQKGRKDIESELKIFNERQELFSIAHCITEHNLEDVDGRLLNLTSQVDVHKLRGDVAEEITTLIDKLNNFEDDEDTGK